MSPWEEDLLFGRVNNQIATRVERQTRFVMLVKIASKNSEAVANALIKHAGKLPQELCKSLTWDRGTEMAGGLFASQAQRHRQAAK